MLCLSKELMKQVVNGKGSVIGVFDGEFVLNGSGFPIYRIDTNEMYHVNFLVS